MYYCIFFFFSSRRRHTRLQGDWSSDVCSSDLHPGRDDKVLASWNGLMALAFAEAGRALGRDDYVRAAVRNVEFVLTSMRRDGRLLRTWKGGQAKLRGYL